MALQLLSTLFDGPQGNVAYNLADLGSAWGVIRYAPNNTSTAWRASMTDPMARLGALTVVQSLDGQMTADGGFVVSGDKIAEAPSHPGALAEEPLTATGDVETAFMDPPTRGMRRYDSTYGKALSWAADPRGGLAVVQPGAQMYVVGGRYQPLKSAILAAGKVWTLEAVKTVTSFSTYSSHMHFGWRAGSEEVTSFDYGPIGDLHYTAGTMPAVTVGAMHVVVAGMDGDGGFALEWMARDTAERGSAPLPGQLIGSTIHVVGNAATLRMLNPVDDLFVAIDVSVNLTTGEVTEAPTELVGYPWTELRVGDYRLPGPLSAVFTGPAHDRQLRVALGAEVVDVPLPGLENYLVLGVVDSVIVGNGLLAIGVSALTTIGREFVTQSRGSVFWAVFSLGQPGNLSAKAASTKGYFS